MDTLRFALVISFAGLAGCTLLSPSTSTGDYKEDLSSQRPKVVTDREDVAVLEEEVVEDVIPSHDQTTEIDKKLAEITSQNRNSNTAAGFTIQVYSGTSREQASEVKTKVYKIIPDSRPETKYEQPVYKVRVGEFGNRLEAQNMYAELLGEFPDAIVIPSRIRLN